jgi:hypothetical protein
MVLSESLQAVVEAMHTSKVQINQAPRQMLRVWVDTNSAPFAPSPLAGEGGTLNCAPSAVAVAGNRAPLSWRPSADTVAGNRPDGPAPTQSRQGWDGGEEHSLGTPPVCTPTLAFPHQEGGKARATKQYPIPPHETARVIYAVPLSMCSRSSVV